MMSIFNRILICLIPIFFTAKAEASSLTAEHHKKLRSLLTELINESYPKLKGVKISIRTLKSKSDYFHAFLRKSHLFKSPRKRTYKLKVNPKIFDAPISEFALKAILAHELAHFEYYIRKNGWKMLGVGWKILTSPKWNRKFERGADVRAMRAGYAEGLKEFRIWLYTAVPKKALKEKKRNYYTPEEIDLWIKENAESFYALISSEFHIESSIARY